LSDRKPVDVQTSEEEDVERRFLKANTLKQMAGIREPIRLE